MSVSSLRFDASEGEGHFKVDLKLEVVHLKNIADFSKWQASFAGVAKQVGLSDILLTAPSGKEFDPRMSFRTPGITRERELPRFSMENFDTPAPNKRLFEEYPKKFDTTTSTSSSSDVSQGILPRVYRRYLSAAKATNESPDHPMDVKFIRHMTQEEKGCFLTEEYLSRAGVSEKEVTVDHNCFVNAPKLERELMLKFYELFLRSTESGASALDSELIERTFVVKPPSQGSSLSKTPMEYALDKTELILFSTNYTFYHVGTGEIEHSKVGQRREYLWTWVSKSLSKGPGAHLIKACVVKGDVAWIYREVKKICTSVSRLTYAQELAKFHTKVWDGADANACRAEIDLMADALEEMGRKLSIDSSIPEKVRCSMLIAAVVREDGGDNLNKRLVLELSAKNPNFDSDDLLSAIREQKIIVDTCAGMDLKANALVGGNSKQPPKAAAQQHKQQVVCKIFKKTGTCSYGSKCRFLHEKEPATTPSPTPRAPAAGGAQNSTQGGAAQSCKKCGSKSHKTEQCSKGLCFYCDKPGHSAANCSKKKADQEKKKLAAANSLQMAEGDSKESEEDLEVEAHTTIIEDELPSGVPQVCGASLSEVSLLLDSGANCVGMKDVSMGLGVKEYKVSVSTSAQGKDLKTSGKGKIAFKLPKGGRLELPTAYFSESFSHNMIGTTPLDRQCGVTTMTHDGRVYLIEKKSIKSIPAEWNILVDNEYDRKTDLPFIKLQLDSDLAVPTRQNDKVLRAHEIIASARKSMFEEGYVCANVARVYPPEKETQDDLLREKLHRCMAHVSAKLVARTAGLPEKRGRFCEACVVGSGESHPHIMNKHEDKKKSQKVEKEEITTSEPVPLPGESVCMDIAGPYCRSLGGSYYFLVFACKATGYVIVKYLKQKSGAFQAIEEATAEFEALSGI